MSDQGGSGKQSSLLRQSNNCRSEKFYSIGPRSQILCMNTLFWQDKCFRATMVKWAQLDLLDRATQGPTETPFYSQGSLEHQASIDWRYPVAIPVRNGYMSIGYRTAHFEKCKQLLDCQNCLLLGDVWCNVLASRLVPSWHYFCPASLTHDWGHFWFTSVIDNSHSTNIDLVVKNLLNT